VNYTNLTFFYMDTLSSSHSRSSAYRRKDALSLLRLDAHILNVVSRIPHSQQYFSSAIGRRAKPFYYKNKRMLRKRLHEQFIM